jgi:hypothetical protein
MDEACGRIYLQGSPDHDKDVCEHGQGCGLIQQGHGFSKPHDMRPQGVPFGTAI